MRVWPSWINDNSLVKAEFNNCLLFIQNISKFGTALLPCRLSSKRRPVSRHSYINEHMFLFLFFPPYGYTPQKLDVIHIIKKYFWRVLAFVPFCFSQ